MATGKLTKRTVDAISKAAKDQFLWDEELRGFGLKVTPAGNKVYLIQYRLGGRGAKTRRYTIGTHGSPWTAAAAREEAERLLQLVRRGTDPVHEKATRERAATDLPFDSYATKFLADYGKRAWRAGTYANAESNIRRYVTKVLGKRPLPTLKRADIMEVFDKLPKDSPALPRNIYALIRKLFGWAVERGDLERSPMEGVKRPSAVAARDRVLKDWELRLAWLAAAEIGYPFGPLYRLLIGTGQRREEVAGLDWRELDRAASDWHLPAKRAKNGIAGTIYLSPAMVAELDGVAGGEKWPRKGLVFSTTGETPVSGYSRAKARLDKAMLALARAKAKDDGEDPEVIEMAPWRVHDFRRTLATGLQRLGVRFEVTEAVLNHVSGSKSGIAGVYQRHDWKDEKRAAWAAWAAHVEGLITGADASNVIALAERRLG